MPAKIEQALGLSWGAPLGETPWNTWMDENLVKLGAVAQISVINKTTTVPPAHVAGNRYIAGAGSSGDWTGKDGQLVFDVDGGWQFYPLRKGWVIHDQVDDSLDLWNGVAFVPVATSADLSGKQDALVSGTNIKTINGSSVLGSGNLVVSGGASVFTDLTDVPASYVGEAGKVVAVNGTEDGLEFIAASGGLPVQSTDLQVDVSTDAELLAALADYWNYQFTEGARYMIRLLTGYTVTTQVNFTRIDAPYLFIFPQTSTTIDCATFVADGFGIKAAFNLKYSRIGGIYGTYTGTNGGTTRPIFSFASRFDMWSPVPSAPSSLNMSGFSGTGGVQLVDWQSRTVGSGLGFSAVFDVDISIDDCPFRGETFTTTGGTVSITSSSGTLNIGFTGASGFLEVGDSFMSITQTASGLVSSRYRVYGESQVFIRSTQSTFSNIGSNPIVRVENGSELTTNISGTWQPQTTSNRFCKADAAGQLSFFGAAATVDDSTAVPDAFGEVDKVATIQSNMSTSGYAFTVSKWVDGGSNPIAANSVEKAGRMIYDAEYAPTSLWGEEVPTEAGTVTPVFGSETISIAPASALTDATIDLTNYAIDGRKVEITFDANGITNVFWLGGTFVGAPSTAAVGDTVSFRYRASNTTFRKVD